ncbi:MAG: hypothetical protein E7591_07095 [Ruminococcaceae bacterium]|nr:hypothetical protein [Oscillospiraceae bacterium]
MKNKEIKFKFLTFDRNRLIISCIYFAVSLTLLTIYGWLPAEYKYTRQFLFVFGFTFLALFLLSLRKILTKEAKMEIYRRVGNAFMNFITKINVIKQKIRKALGLKESTLLYSDDEKRIVIKENSKRGTRKRDALTQKRFSHLDNDRDRIRYIYASFMKAERKKGESVDPDKTPKEIKTLTAKNDTEKKLFDLYTPVRYSRDISPTGEEIKEQYDYFSRKIKLK